MISEYGGVVCDGISLVVSLTEGISHSYSSGIFPGEVVRVIIMLMNKMVDVNRNTTANILALNLLWSSSA